MIPTLKLKAFADSTCVLEAQRSQAQCVNCQEFYGKWGGWAEGAHRQPSYLRELIKDIVSLSQIILHCLRYEEAFACALLPIHMAISGAVSNAAREVVSIRCANCAGRRQ